MENSLPEGSQPIVLLYYEFWDHSIKYFKNLKGFFDEKSYSLFHDLISISII